jgi:hypothetical protein
VIAAAEGRFELRRVNDTIRSAEAKAIESGARLTVEVDSMGENASRIRVTASNRSDKSKAAVTSLLTELQWRVEEYRRFARVGASRSITADDVRQIVEWARLNPPILDQYRLGTYPVGSRRSKITRSMLTILTPYMRIVLVARALGQSLKPLLAENLSAEMAAPQVQVLVEPYDLGESFHPLFRYRTPDHIVLLPAGAVDSTLTIQPLWTALRTSEWPEIFDLRTTKVLMAAFRPSDIKPGMIFAVIYKDANSGERKEERIPITERQLLLWNIPIE